MRFFRRVIDDGMSGGVLGALLAVMLLLQGVVGGFVQAAAALEMDGIICSSHSSDAPARKHQSDQHRTDCCLSACHLAAVGQTVLPSPISVPSAGLSSAPVARRWIISYRPALRIAGLPGSQRAPPILPA